MKPSPALTWALRQILVKHAAKARHAVEWAEHDVRTHERNVRDFGANTPANWGGELRKAKRARQRLRAELKKWEAAIAEVE